MEITVRPLLESELDEADRIFRLAFGTFLRMPDPLRFAGDSDYVRTRWRADPSASFAALRDGELLGSNFATRWGSFGFFGPLTIRPELWDQGIAKRLLDATMERFDAWRLSHAGLFTFSESPKHLVLYGRYGFAPRFLTVVMQKHVGASGAPRRAERLSALPSAEQAAAVEACRSITDSILAGLDVSHEIEAVQTQGLGDTVVLTEASEPRAFAVCHVGAGTEGGGGTCYVKFAAVRPGPSAAEHFARLLDAVEDFAAERAATTLMAGVNTARHDAYRTLLAHGFRIALQGVAMQRPSEPGFNRDDVWVLDDWR